MKMNVLNRLALLVMILMATPWLLAAQGCGQSSSATTSQSSASSAQDQSSKPDQSQNNQDNKNKKKDKKKKASQDDLDTTVFSEAVAADVIAQFMDGVNGHSYRTTRSAVADSKMDGY